MFSRTLLALGILAVSAIAADVAEPLTLIGFHEGARRVVECKGAAVTGVEVGYVEDGWAFAEPFIGSIKLLCPNKTVTIEYSGETADTYVFGRNDLKTFRKAECPGDLGVAGFKWRPAEIRNPDGAEARQAGLVVLCNRADNAPSEVVLEHGAPAGKSYPSSFSCKQVAAYAGLPAPRVTKVQLWFNRKSLAGVEVMECA